MKTPLQILIDARKLIDSPEKWCQFQFYQRRGNVIARCASQAIDACCPSHLTMLNKTAKSVLGRAAKCPSIPAWNDEPSRTHAEVMAAFDTAIELARNEEAK